MSWGGNRHCPTNKDLLSEYFFKTSLQLRSLACPNSPGGSRPEHPGGQPWPGLALVRGPVLPHELLRAPVRLRLHPGGHGHGRGQEVLPLLGGAGGPHPGGEERRRGQGDQVQFFFVSQKELLILIFAVNFPGCST